MLSHGGDLSLSVFGHVPACETLLDKVTFKAPIQLSLILLDRIYKSNITKSRHLKGQP